MRIRGGLRISVRRMQLLGGCRRRRCGRGRICQGCVSRARLLVLLFRQVLLLLVMMRMLCQQCHCPVRLRRAKAVGRVWLRIGQPLLLLLLLLLMCLGAILLLLWLPLVLRLQ